jgi:DNA processing protein
MLGIGSRGPLGPSRIVDEDDPVAVLASASHQPASPGNKPSGGGVPISISEREAWAVVASANEVGPATMGRLVRAFGSPAAVLDVAQGRRARSALSAVLGEVPGEAAVAGLMEAARTADRTVGDLRRSKVDFLIEDDAEYPPALRAIDLPPPVLFVRGDRSALSAEPAVAIVGTRRPTEHGRRIASRIAAAVVGCDGTVVSGLAVGIDGAAHAAALESHGRTVAVLGGGHGRLFPAAHERLADEIAGAGGAIVSEFLPWVEPLAWSFPRRNRIISGLASATVVVEAGRRSGALITARWALDQGRGCFLVPGEIDARASAGCLAFLREYRQEARLVAGIPELLVDLELVGDATGPAARRGRTTAALAEVGAVERQVGGLIAAGVATVDAIVDATELPVATVLAAVTMLETRGLVVDALGRYRAAGALEDVVGRRPDGG